MTECLLNSNIHVLCCLEQSLQNYKHVSHLSASSDVKNICTLAAVWTTKWESAVTCVVNERCLSTNSPVDARAGVTGVNHWNHAEQSTDQCRTAVAIKQFTGNSLMNICRKYQVIMNKRSKDLGALLDSCSWDDSGNFLQTCIKNSLLHWLKSTEIWINSPTVPHYACISSRSYSTP